MKGNKDGFREAIAPQKFKRAFVFVCPDDPVSDETRPASLQSLYITPRPWGQLLCPCTRLGLLKEKYSPPTTPVNGLLLWKSGPEGSRTLDLCIANAALSQLSYRPKKWLSRAKNATAAVILKIRSRIVQANGARSRNLFQVCHWLCQCS